MSEFEGHESSAQDDLAQNAAERETLLAMIRGWTLEQQVAQRLILGYSGILDTASEKPLPQGLERFVRHGLGGVIFFRENFLGLIPDNVMGVVHQLNTLVNHYPQALPTPFLSLDQEGGQIERLLSHQFPSLVSPMAVGLKTQETDNGTFCAEVYDMMAFYLNHLGFNLNFFPTLDVNLEPLNPIIGVRAFGEDPDVVWRCAKIVLERFQARGIIGVGKHFPGHGEGVVDSHETLPWLHLSEDALQPFRDAIAFGIPAIMVAHGYYPALQEGIDPEGTPASLSKRVVTGLLREELGFKGLILSDDCCMGAIVERQSPVESALAAWRAGVDILIYKDSSDTQWAVFEGVVSALKAGLLDISQHEAALVRILQAKATMPKTYPYTESNLQIKEKQWLALFDSGALAANSDLLAHQAITVLQDDGTIELPLALETQIAVIEPDLTTIHHYTYDEPEVGFQRLWEQEGYALVFNQTYRLQGYQPFPVTTKSPDLIFYVTYDLQRDPSQIRRYIELTEEFPEAKLVLVSGNTPYEAHAMGWHGEDIEEYAFKEAVETVRKPNLHLALCGLRSQHRKALVDWFFREISKEKPSEGDSEQASLRENPGN